MSKIEQSAKAVNDYLLKLDLVKEYKKYEALLHEHEEIRCLEVKIKALQKKIVSQKAKQDSRVTKTIEEYQKYKDDFENHPVVVNYLYLKQEVDFLLQDVNMKINSQLLNKDLTKR